MVEADTAGEALLGEGAGLVDEEFVYLLRVLGVSHYRQRRCLCCLRVWW